VSNIKLVHSGGNSVSLTTPTSNPSSNITFKLPQADGSAGQVLQTDGSGNLSFAESGTVLQVKHKYLTSSSQLAKGGAIGELTTDLRIDFTPKAADSNLIMEFNSSFVSPNSPNLQFCLFYDNTAGAGVSLPPANGSRSRVHWTNRTRPYDPNDNNFVSAKIVTPANNTNARQYTIHWGTEGAASQFFTSTLSGAGAGTVYPMTFIIMEIAA